METHSQSTQQSVATVHADEIINAGFHNAIYSAPKPRLSAKLSSMLSHPGYWRGKLPKLVLALLVAVCLLVVVHAQTYPNLTDPQTKEAVVSIKPTHEERTFGNETPSSTPFTLQQKRELCKHDHDNYNIALRLMTVNPNKPRVSRRKEDAAPRYPRIFCYVNTISPYHKTHAQLVADTWGQRCDKLVFFSNDTGTMVVHQGTEFETRYPILKMNAPADYFHLWMKHREVVQYIHDHYRHDFDWFYKADDDAYLVVDNLREYLRRPEIVMNHRRQPMQLGKRFRLPDDSPDRSIDNKDVTARWHKVYDRWVFNSGGPGYAMNRLFLDKFVASMQDKTCLSEPWAEVQPEDTSTSYCMMWHGAEPWDTRDLQGRPRWHALSPGDNYVMDPETAKGYWLDFHTDVGGLKWGDDCCAPDSISYHYVKGQGMYHMERMLHYCREGDEIVDLADFNRKYGLAISDKILVPPV